MPRLFRELSHQILKHCANKRHRIVNTQKDSIPFLSLEYGEVNPNHKLRLLGLFIPNNRWITNVAFKRSDDSIYLAPQLSKTFTVVGMTKDNIRFSFESSPESEIHISLHDGGVVNIMTKKIKYRLKSAHERASLEIITLGIKDPANLKVATDSDVNALPARYKIVPVPGFFTLSPIFVTFFRIRSQDTWEMPFISRTFQTQVGIKLKGIETKYEIVEWQNPDILKIPGDIAFSLGS